MINYFLIFYSLFFVSNNLKQNLVKKNSFLSQTEFIVSDTAKYESLKLYLHNFDTTDIVVNKLDVSCSCVLATLQRNVATSSSPAYIYVAVSSYKIKKEDLYSVTLVCNNGRKYKLEIRK